MLYVTITTYLYNSLYVTLSFFIVIILNFFVCSYGFNLVVIEDVLLNSSNGASIHATVIHAIHAPTSFLTLQYLDVCSKVVVQVASIKILKKNLMIYVV